jgi:hypothetical protein
MKAPPTRRLAVVIALVPFMSCTPNEDDPTDETIDTGSEVDTESEPEFDSESDSESDTELDPEPLCIDRDRDGFRDGCDAALDCDDSDPLVSPSMPEIPGDGKDNDCEGGDLPPSDEIGIFVSENGDDSKAGTNLAPVATLARAVELAEQSGKVVFAANDTFRESVTTRVSLFGGYDRNTWQRQAKRTMLLAVDGAAITVLGDDVVIDNFHIEGQYDPEMNGIVSLGGTVYITNNLIFGCDPSGYTPKGFYGYPAVFGTRALGVHVAGGRASIVHNVIAGGSFSVTPLSNQGIDIEVDLEGTGILIENAQAELVANMLVGGGVMSQLSWDPYSYTGHIYPQSYGYDTSTNRMTSEAVRIVDGSVRLADNDIYQGHAGVIAFPYEGAILPPNLQLTAAVRGVHAINVEELQLRDNRFRIGAPQISSDYLPPGSQEPGYEIWIDGSLPSSSAAIAARQRIDADVESVALEVTGALMVTLDSNRIRSVPAVVGVASKKADSDVRASSVAIELTDCGGVTLTNNGAMPGETTVNSYAAEGTRVEALTISLRASGVEDCAAIHNTFLTTKAIGSGKSPVSVPQENVQSSATGILLEETSADLINNILQVENADQRAGLKNLDSDVLLAGNDLWFPTGTDSTGDICLIQTASECLSDIAQVDSCEFEGCTEAQSNFDVDPDVTSQFELNTSSAVIDRGVDPDDYGFEVDEDIDGEVRPQGEGFDVGADEVSP